MFEILKFSNVASDFNKIAIAGCLQSYISFLLPVTFEWLLIYIPLPCIFDMLFSSIVMTDSSQIDIPDP